MSKYHIHKDIKQAHTLPGSFYHNQEDYHKLLETVFYHSWHFLADKNIFSDDISCVPLQLNTGKSVEEIILLKDKDIKCLSNICTHRGKVIVEKASKLKMLSCSYHGRCFDLEGKFKSMPEFKEVLNFPTENDNLKKLDVKNIGTLLFTSLHSKVSFDKIFEPFLNRLFWFPFDELKFDASSSEEYLIDVNWALYCDNYLEGFHVPFVHPALDEKLDYGLYDTELFEYSNVQVGHADNDATFFDLPEESEDFGKKIHAYYWWFFPNLMLNVYTWGISINIVEPLTINKTKVRFLTYLLPEKNANGFSKELLHKTEMEDEEVVLSVQKGTKSSFYNSGRFSAKREQGVHHFHRLIDRYL
jgi:choline monooxygenase